jgi:hypothetical protein
MARIEFFYPVLSVKSMVNSFPTFAFEITETGSQKGYQNQTIRAKPRDVDVSPEAMAKRQRRAISVKSRQSFDPDDAPKG